MVEGRTRRALQAAQKYSLVANSVKSQIIFEPTIEIIRLIGTKSGEGTYMEAMITAKPTTWAEVNEQGDLVIPRDMVEQFGLMPGARVRMESDTNHVRLHRPVTHLAKVYVEPTIYCNLDCRTCIRNVWDEKLGLMTDANFCSAFWLGIQIGVAAPIGFLWRSGRAALS